MSARAATSLLRRPGTRRRLPEGRPACSGGILARREVRNSRTSAWLSTLSTVRPARVPRDVLAVHPLMVPRYGGGERVTWMTWCFPSGHQDGILHLALHSATTRHPGSHASASKGTPLMRGAMIYAPGDVRF